MFKKLACKKENYNYTFLVGLDFIYDYKTNSVIKENYLYDDTFQQNIYFHIILLFITEKLKKMSKSCFYN